MENKEIITKKQEKKSFLHYERGQWKGHWNENMLQINFAKNEKSVNLCVWHVIQHSQWKIGWQNLSRKSTLSCGKNIVAKYLEIEMEYVNQDSVVQKDGYGT